MNPDQNKFKLILMGIFGFCILLGLVAFSTFRSNNSANNKTVVNIWGTINKVTFDDFVTQYKQDKTVDLKLNYTYKNIDTIDGDLVEAIATGKAPDVILVPQTLIKRYVDKVYMMTTIPIRTFEDTFVQEAQLYIQPDGIFALPFFVDPLVMYYNKDSFSNALIPKPPVTWAEFPLLASKLSKSDTNANIVLSAASFGEFSNVDNAKALLSAWIMQDGSPIVSYENGKFVSKLNYQSPIDVLVPADTALRFYTDYSNPKKTVYSWNRSLPSSKQYFLSENLATYFGFASEYGDIKEKNPNLNFDVAMLPQILDAKSKSTFGQIYGFSILRSSPNIQAAMDLIMTLISSDSVSIYLNAQNVAPARIDLISTGTPDPIKTIFYNSALISKGWIDPDSAKTDQVFQDMVENITTGRTNVDDSVTKASAELDNLLQ